MLKPPFHVVSDTHWFHKNIVKFCNRDMNHNWIMVNRWNKVVGPTDKILHLGDLLLTTNPDLQNQFFNEVAPQLQGEKYLILGNHDNKHWIDYYEAVGFRVIQPFNMKYRGYDISFDHYPTEKGLIGRGEQHIRVHGHIHSNGYQHIHSSKKEYKRYGNINVSVEVIDYTPQPIERLLDKAIAEMKPRQQYVNVNSKSNGTKQANRHAA